jgi:hypothetical protein
VRTLASSIVDDKMRETLEMRTMGRHSTRTISARAASSMRTHRSESRMQTIAAGTKVACSVHGAPIMRPQC